MCGAAPEQRQMFTAQSAFYSQMTAEYTAVFGKQQAILDSLTATFKPILDAGPDQKGFGGAEETALRTQANEGVAKNYSDATDALEEGIAARGGDAFIPSGADNQLRASVAEAAAAEKSNLDTNITKENFDQGRKNWEVAAQELGLVAGQENPVGFAEATTGSGKAASDTANEIAAASNSIWGAALGAVGGVAGQAAGGWAGRKKGG